MVYDGMGIGCFFVFGLFFFTHSTTGFIDSSISSHDLEMPFFCQAFLLTQKKGQLFNLGGDKYSLALGHPVIPPQVWCLIGMFFGSSHTEPQEVVAWMSVGKELQV